MTGAAGRSGGEGAGGFLSAIGRLLPGMRISAEPDEAGADEEEAAPVRASRRERRADQADAIVRDALSQKVLRAWLQNRNQTLVPLALNLRSLDAEGRTLVVRAMAAAQAATGQDAAPPGDLLARIGAGEAERALLADARAQEAGLGGLLDAVRARDLGAYAYAASLMVLDQRRLVSRLYLAFLASRLSLPEDVVSSLDRRYRT
ncbi:DUF533 domain-containing protein [Methylobacterium oryzihabitans]|uniref:DUF533 domain-containing protein n=1 Tax=Methylobacterium oryzihabitans TaxID=2499852 RepID=A0A3S2V4C4_9HYPH|nr:DUF533 domain-containing protein [Methylobacterium oryzihabitans]RVU13177.1 DUF533 domain-containing protein [Methylobacterium oryzihabitans]